MNNRREFLSKMAVLTALTSLPGAPLLASSKRAESGNTETIFLSPPYLQNLNPNGASICFITGVETLCWLEIIDEGEKRQIFNKKDGFIDVGKGLITFHLDNLVPGKSYQYQVHAKEIRSFKPYELEYGDSYSSESFQFKTPLLNADSVSCLILNDIHDRPNSFKELINLTNKEYEFVFLNGDMFDYQTDEAQLINHLIQPCSAVFASERPFILSRGNHETRGKFARQLKDYFVYPEENYYFAFQQGPVFFIVLDTGEDKPDETPVYANIVDFDAYRKEQERWLEDIMNSKAYQEAPFKLVFMHIPPYYSGNWHGPMHCRELFAPLFDRYQIDMVIAGHTHTYGVHAPTAEHSYPILIGGGPKAGKRTLMHLEANEKRLKVAILRDDGEEVGNYEVLRKG